MAMSCKYDWQKSVRHKIGTLNFFLQIAFKRSPFNRANQLLNHGKFVLIIAYDIAS